MDYLGAVLIVAAAATAFVVIARRAVAQARRTQVERARTLALAKRAAEADVTLFADALKRLLTTADDHPLIAGEYQHAASLHVRAAAALAAARTPDELSVVTELLEEGRWTTARLTARAAGEPMPSRRPPCFFNPGHGPSMCNVGWQGRSVPACAADAARIEEGADPYIRTVERDDRRVPYWEGGPTYAGWASGYYSSWRGSPLVADVTKA